MRTFIPVLGALFVVVATSCGAPPEDGEAPQLVARAQDNPAPPGCSGWDQVPIDFHNRCALWGGERMECSGGAVWCCKTGVDKDGDEYEHCTQNPRIMPPPRVLASPGVLDRVAR